MQWKTIEWQPFLVLLEWNLHLSYLFVIHLVLKEKNDTLATVLWNQKVVIIAHFSTENIMESPKFISFYRWAQRFPSFVCN